MRLSSIDCNDARNILKYLITVFSNTLVFIVSVLSMFLFQKFKDENEQQSSITVTDTECK